MFTILQLCDSGFPTGGFSHSVGSESVIRNLLIQDADDLNTFVIGSMENIGSFNLPFVKAAYLCVNEEELIKLDVLLNVSTTNHVAKRASIQQGKTLLCTAFEAFSIPRLESLQNLVDNGRIFGHQAVIFGVLCSSFDITALQCAEMFMFTTLRTIIASLVRLGKIGAIEAQKFQMEMQICLKNIINKNWEKLPEDANVTFPILDVLQMSHDTMFSKLFIS